MPNVMNTLAVESSYNFDFGNGGTENGYISVDATTAYSTSLGYGFNTPNSIKNVTSSGTGALSDAVQFVDSGINSDNTFNIDLENGLYKVTVTLGNTNRTSVVAEGVLQLINMTGDNATDSFLVPITDGQLNILATAGKEGYPYTMSALNIEKVSDVAEMPQTIWICGDSTVCNYYPLDTSVQGGWGQMLNQFVDDNTFQVRNMASAGQYAKGFYDSGQFDTILKYIKKGDYYIISIGINDSNYSNEQEYYETVTSMVEQVKAKGGEVILVKQQGRSSDVTNNPNLKGRWYGSTLDTIGSEQNVQVVDLFTLALDYYKSIGQESTDALYMDGDTLHENRQGAIELARLVASQIDFKSLSDIEQPSIDIPDITFTKGDLNNDGKIDIIDYVLLKNTLLYGTDDNLRNLSGDINDNQNIDIIDTMIMKKYLLGMIDGFPNVIIEPNNIYYACDAEIYQGVTETLNEGYTGKSYVNLDNVIGSYINWTVEVPESGNYEVTFRYANGGLNDRPVNISVNGSEQYAYVNFPKTASFTDWSTQTAVVYLNEGTNTIKVTSAMSDGASNIDYLSLKSTTKPIDSLITPPKEGARQVEKLNRGVSASYTGSGMLVSWRILGTDDDNTTFKLYKNGQTPPIYEGSINDATCFLDTQGTPTDFYTIDTFVNGEMTEFAQASINLPNKNSGQSGAYLDIPLDIPDEQTMPDGTVCTYSANDCSVGDVDGDGQYEIIVKWYPSNATDNTNIGYTGTTFLDCYKLDGTKLWRIDLGINIRSGAHYTQFMVYDFDGDGKAELICKTADGTTDGTGAVIGDATADHRTNIEGSNSHGILTGNEFLTLFDGETGKAIDTINYEPSRGNINDWGDNYGNRVDRFLAGVAYLDGKTPSAVFCRGYYTRVAMVSYDVVDKKLVKRWTFDTGFDSNNPYYGQGNHSLAVADVDQDGKDEIVYGSCTIDDDGTGLYSTGLCHGDALHVGDLVPDRDGLEVFAVHEEEKANYGASLRDAKTGEILWKIDATDDTGRGIAGNFTDKYPGMLFTSVADNKLYYYDASTSSMVDTGETWANITKWGMNSMVWWTGDLERETLDRSMVDKYNVGRVFTGDGVAYNNSSKSNACITCDLFGDWREEIIMRTTDDKYLRIFATTYETDYALTTLMHDTQYRCGVAIENVGYNQPPNTSFFLGTGYDLPERPNIYTP